LNNRILIIVFSIALISISPQVFAQEDLGTVIENQKIVLEIGKQTNIHVKHIIEFGAWGENAPRLIKILEGGHSNLIVADEDGDKIFFSYDGDTFEESEYIILNQKLASYDLIAEYDLVDFMEKDGELWSKEIVSKNDIQIMFDDDLETIIINSRPIDVSNVKGINCVGCQMFLEYFDNEKYSKYFIDAYDKKFKIEFLSNGKIQDIRFADNLKLLHFDVEKNNQLIIIKIPHSLLLDPYDVYLTEKNIDNEILENEEKIRKSEFLENETHSSVSFRPAELGTIVIIGATQDEHNKKLEVLENKISNSKNAQVIEEKRGALLPLPGQISSEKETIDEEVGVKLSFENEFEKGPVTSQDNTMIIVIIVIIVTIIVGIIIKLKKN